LKTETRVIGIDDGDTRRKRRLVVGAVFRGGLWLDGIVSTFVDVSASSPGRILGKMVTTSKFYKELRYAILHGSMLQSARPSLPIEFNSITRLPTITILKPRWNKRFDYVTKRRKNAVNFKLHGLSVLCLDLTKEKATQVFGITCIRGGLPEPVRVAGLIASAANAQKD